LNEIEYDRPILFRRICLFLFDRLSLEEIGLYENRQPASTQSDIEEFSRIVLERRRFKFDYPHFKFLQEFIRQKNKENKENNMNNDLEITIRCPLCGQENAVKLARFESEETIKAQKAMDVAASMGCLSIKADTLVASDKCVSCGAEITVNIVIIAGKKYT
jgi:transcription elongation factor Elf1